MDGTAESRSVEIRVVTDEHEWEGLKPAWSELFDVSPQASATLHFDWLRNWWRVYGARYGGPLGLRIVTIWRSGRLIGALPLYEAKSASELIGVRRLLFLSSGEDENEETCADYLDLLSWPGEEVACVDALNAHLAATTWDQVELLDMPETSPLAANKGLGLAVSAVIDSRGDCPIADLSGGFDAYLGRLSANGRQNARRLIRDADKVGVLFQIAAASETIEFFNDLIQLHTVRWNEDGRTGLFTSERFTEFHRSMAEHWIPAGRALLGRLSLPNEHVAVIYGFVNGRKFDFYQSGVRMTVPGLKSPGILAHLLLMRALAARGVQTYDFLRGATQYKERLATGRIPLVRLRIRRHNVRTVVGSSAAFAKRALRACIRRLQRLAHVVSEPKTSEPAPTAD